MSAQSRRHREARLVAVTMALAAILIGVSSCEGDEEKQQDPCANDRAQVAENDVVQCGMTGTLFDNRTTGAYSLHARVKTVNNGCSWSYTYSP